MHATTSIGYQFAGDLFCPEHILPVLNNHYNGLSRFVKDGNGTEDALDRLAAYHGIDRMNEYSFDSDDFPKVVFGDYDGYGQCGVCGDYISGHTPEDDEDPTTYFPGDVPDEEAYEILGLVSYGGSIIQLLGEKDGKRYIIAADHRMAQAIIEHLCDRDDNPIAWAPGWAVTLTADDAEFFHPEAMDR